MRCGKRENILTVKSLNIMVMRMLKCSQFNLIWQTSDKRGWQLTGNMGRTVDAGYHCCSDTRDAPGDPGVFLCDLGGFGVWM